ncbi:MAG: hypothetical protein Q9161_001608 [Pseudevernia consocians]
MSRKQLLQNGGAIMPDPPCEELTASGFVAIVFYLFVDINLDIHRTFKRKQGLYYWCMLLGTWGCVIDSIAVVLKSFLPNSQRLWPLYTLFILVGWTIYAPAQLLVLYSRLHLVNRNVNLQRRILIMIIAVAALMIIPTWSLVWQAYDPYNPRLSALYSPREAIVDRCTQLGYTIAENIIGGIYIWSLVKLLNLKSSVRQRRVMTDLIYVNVIAVCLDILTVVLVFLNQTGISHPIQTFSYILKLKLEFMVLNQLMAVAARGRQKESFAERRYHHSFTSGDRGVSAAEPSKPEPAPDLVLPSPTVSKVQRTPDGSALPTTHDHTDGGRWPLNAKVKKRGSNGADNDAEEGEEIGVHMWENNGKWIMEVPWFQTKGRRA